LKINGLQSKFEFFQTTDFTDDHRSENQESESSICGGNREKGQFGTKCRTFGAFEAVIGFPAWRKWVCRTGRAVSAWRGWCDRTGRGVFIAKVAKEEWGNGIRSAERVHSARCRLADILSAVCSLEFGRQDIGAAVCWMGGRFEQIQAGTVIQRLKVS
jgi:hypothetical protein